MAQYIVETPGQATSHGEQWSAVAKLVKRTLEQSQREVLDVVTETFSTGFATRSTVGIMLKENCIDQMVVGGPAHMCNLLDHGDEIISVDGQATPTKEAVLPLLRGSDVPGSNVDITVKKRKDGRVETVSLVRMPTEEIADRRKLFELFTEIKAEALSLSDKKLSILQNQVIDLWSKMVLADMVHDQKIEENVKELQAQLKALLEEVDGELPKLKVSFEENKELAALRAQFKQQEAELAKSKSLCDSQEDLIKQLKEQLAASQKELSDTKERDAKIIEDKDREIAELKKQLRDLKSDDDAKIAELAAQIEELKKKLAAADDRGNKEEAEKNRWKGEKESLDSVVKSKDDEIEKLKKQLAALEKSLNETKAALEQDESELKKDRELLLKDKEMLAAKDAEIEDLRKKVAALEQELKNSKEKAVSDLKAKDSIIAERDAEIEELKKRLAILEKELRDMKDAASKNDNTIIGLEEEIKRLKAKIEEQDARIKQDADTIKRCQQSESDLTKALQLANQKVASLEADCVKKDKEIEELRRQLEEALKKLRDCQESLASSENEKAALKKQVEDLNKKVAKLENDIKLGTEQLAAKDAEIDTLKKKVAELEDELKKLRQQLAGLKEEMDKLTKELAALKEERDKLAKQGAVAGDLEAELKKLREQLAALKEERDKLAKEAALLKDAQDEIERLKKLLADMEAALKLLQGQEKTAKKAVDFDLERAIQLTTWSKELVAKEHWIAHELIQEHTDHTAAPIKNRTTIGIAFDEKSCVITNVLVGGPAFNSKKVFKGDKIVSIDSVPVNDGHDIIPRLKGSDVPGSVVTISLQRKDSTSVDDVKLRRMDNTQIADKRQIFELFTKLIDKSHKNRDKDSENYTTEALDLWTAEMLEEHEHDERCLENLHKMQRETDVWLEELLQILMCSGQGEIKKTAPPQIERAAAPPAAPLISKEDLEKLQKENEDLKKKLAAVQQDLENLRPKLSQLQQELQGANSALDSCAAAANRKDAEIEDLKKRLAALEAKLKEKAEDENLKKRVAELEQLLAAQSAAADELEKLRAKLASIQSELKVATNALDAATKGMLAKDAEIEDLKKRLAALEKELKAARDDMNDAGTKADELQKLLAKLAALQSELKTATNALAAASEGMLAKDAEIEDLKKRLAALQNELQAARDEMDDSASKQAQISKCRELIAMSQRRIAEDHLAEHEILTHADQSATTIGLMFDETGGKIHVDYVMVGGPAFKTKNIAKNDIILSIDGKKLQGDNIIKALQGPANTVVTLEVEKAQTGKVEMVEVERMPTAIIADKRKMFDLFTKIEGGFNKHKDPAGIRNTEDALELWTNMLIEEKDHDDKCLAKVCAMQRDTNSWLTECDHILAKINGEPIIEMPAPSVPGANGALSSPRGNPSTSALTGLSGNNNQVATLNQAMKKMEQELRKEQDKRKNLESELQFLKALDKKLAKASEGFNENSRKEAPAPENQKTSAVGGFSAFYSFFGGPKKESIQTESQSPRYTVVKNLEGPVQWDDDFLLDLLEMPEMDSAVDVRVSSLSSSLGGTPSCSAPQSPRSRSPNRERPGVGVVTGSI